MALSDVFLTHFGESGEHPLGVVLYVTADVVDDTVFAVFLTAALDIVVSLALLLHLAVIQCELCEYLTRLTVKDGGSDVAFVDVDGDDRLSGVYCVEFDELSYGDV